MARSAFPRGLAVAGREAAAFARQAWLLRYDVMRPVVPEDVRDDDDVVVFLHGLFASAGVLRPLRTAMLAHPRVHAAAVSYPPGPGIVELAARLHAIVRPMPEGVHLHLVGHSFGGVVARYFAQEMGDPRIVQTISLATPFAGLPRARMLGIAVARDLDDESPLLRRLLLSASVVPHLSIVAANDALIPSPISHVLPGGDVVVIDGCGHNTLLFHDGVARIIAERVLARRIRREAH